MRGKGVNHCGNSHSKHEHLVPGKDNTTTAKISMLMKRVHVVSKPFRVFRLLVNVSTVMKNPLNMKATLYHGYVHSQPSVLYVCMQLRMIYDVRYLY